MRKYQLIGRKKLFSKSKQFDYPPLHILLLPNEVLIEILTLLARDTKALLALTRTCSKFRTLVNKYFLYQSIDFTPSRFHKFVAYHLPGYSSSLSKKLGLNDSSSQINLIQRINFKNPPTSKSANDTANIAGSYSVEDVHSGQNRNAYNDFVSGLRYLLKEDFALKAASICEVSPGFGFPSDSYSIPRTSTLSWSKPKATRTLQHLKIGAQSGWSIPFNFSQMSVFFSIFDVVEELELTNFIIDREKLTLSSVPHLRINKITLNACTYISQKLPHTKHSACPMFEACHKLTLRNIHTGLDLSVIDFIKSNNRLSSLTLDMESPVFYSVVNGERRFNFARYNLFFKLLCSGEGGFASLKDLGLENFDLMNSCAHAPSPSQDDDWIPPPTDTFEIFLEHVSTIPKLTICLKKEHRVTNVCVRCGHSKSEQQTSTHSMAVWQNFLRNADSGACTVTVTQQ